MKLEAFEEAVEQFELLFKSNGHISSEIMAFDKFEELYNEYLRPYVKQKPYVLENFIINIFFSKTMPFEDDNSIWDSYVNLCAYLALLKIMVVCLTAKYGKLDDELMLKAVFSFSRRYLHNQAFSDVLKEIFFTQGNDSMAYVVSIINN